MFLSLWKEYQPPRVVPHSCYHTISRVLGLPPTPEVLPSQPLPQSQAPKLAALGFGLWHAGDSGQPSTVGGAMIPAPQRPQTCGKPGGTAPSSRSGWTRAVNDARSRAPKLAVWLKEGTREHGRFLANLVIQGRDWERLRQNGGTSRALGHGGSGLALGTGSAQQSGRVQLARLAVTAQARRPVGES